MYHSGTRIAKAVDDQLSIINNVPLLFTICNTLVELTRYHLKTGHKYVILIKFTVAPSEKNFGNSVKDQEEPIL